MPLKVVEGDLFQQPVEAIVNPWNRNFIPWWLLLPQGVSGQLKKKAGRAPFRELSKYGMLQTGEAVHTSAGRLDYRYIIHVVALEWYWRATDRSIRMSTEHAVELAEKLELESIAFPLIGSGTGGKKQSRSVELITQACRETRSDLSVTVVRYRKNSGGRA